MILGIFARTFPATDAETSLRAAAAAGYATVQFNMQCAGLTSLPDRVAAPLIAEIRRASGAAQVSIAALSATYNMVHPDPGVRARGRRSLAVLAATARAIGAPLVTLCTGSRDADDQWRRHPDNDSAAAWRDLLAEMEAAVAAAEENDILLGIEPEAANVVRDAATAERLIATLASPRLRIVLDPANLFVRETADRQRAIVSDAIQRLAPRISLAHAKDRDTDGRFVAAGAGVLDYRHFLRELKQAGYDGPLVTHGLSPDEAPGVRAFLADALATSA